MLTKEECINALENIIFNVGVARSDYRTSGKAKEDYHALNSLIEEHFSNPPLKWEEIHEDTWFWDNKECEYAFLDKAYINDKNEKKIRVWSGMISYWYIFEDNRFYRKQVEE